MTLSTVWFSDLFSDNKMETAQKMVSIQKQRSMEALDKLRTYALDSRRSSAVSGISGMSTWSHGRTTPRSLAGRRTVSTTNAPDPQLVDTAAKFVQEIIDKAKNEAAAKINTETLVRINLDHLNLKQLINIGRIQCSLCFELTEQRKTAGLPNLLKKKRQDLN